MPYQPKNMDCKAERCSDWESRLIKLNNYTDHASTEALKNAMLALVLSDNILFLFIFWEVMGLMSYLLIGHFSQDPDHPRMLQAAKAGNKAFMTTRVGDVLLLIGIFLPLRRK